MRKQLPKSRMWDILQEHWPGLFKIDNVIKTEKKKKKKQGGCSKWKETTETKLCAMIDAFFNSYKGHYGTTREIRIWLHMRLNDIIKFLGYVKSTVFM